MTDVCAELAGQVLADGGPITVDGEAHRLLPELRRQRAQLARLVTSLRLPDLEDEDEGGKPAKRPGRRGTRGFYAVKGGA